MPPVWKDDAINGLQACEDPTQYIAVEFNFKSQFYKSNLKSIGLVSETKFLGNSGHDAASILTYIATVSIFRKRLDRIYVQVTSARAV